MKKKILSIACILLLLGAFSCKKKELEPARFEVTYTMGTTSCDFHWDAITFSDFKNVSIYRSLTPIPEPTFNNNIDGSLLIGAISDRSITSFTDSNLVMNSEGKSYYRLVMNFGNRFLYSDQFELNRIGFSLVLGTSSFGSSFDTYKFPAAHKLYFVDYSMQEVKAIDYYTGNVITTPLSLSQALPPVFAVNAGAPEMFVYLNAQIKCYDALTLALKYAITVGSAATFCVKNNYLYVADYSGVLRTYNLVTKGQIDQESISGSIYSNSLLVAPGSGNSVYLRYQISYYNSQMGQQVFVNKIRVFSLSNGATVDSTYVPASVINPDSMNNSNSYMDLNFSPDGKYMTRNGAGMMYDMINQSSYNITSTSSFWVLPSYSPTGGDLVARPLSVPFGRYWIDLYTMPSFNKKKSLRSPNVVDASGMRMDDFMSHDTLISYNVRSAFTGNLVETKLTVFFNKID